MSKLRIGWFYQDLNPGGGQRVCRELSRIFARRGNDVKIVVPRGRAGGTTIEGVEVIQAGPLISRPAAAITAALPFMLPMMGRRDAVISSMPFMGFLNALAPGVKLKYHWLQHDDVTFFDDGSHLRSGFSRKLYRTSARWSYRLPLKFWSNSRWSADKFREQSGKKAEIVHPGVDTNVFKPDPAVKPLSGLIGAVGRRAKIKGLEDLVAALNLAAERGLNFRLRLFSREKLELERARFPWEIVSPADDLELSQGLQECEIFAGSSWREGFYLPALEAMACGVVVAATDSGGSREYAAHGVNMLVVPPRSPEELAATVARLLADSELRRRLALAGVETARRFTWERAANQIEGIFERDLAEP